jgi:hypothetical protein
MAHAAQSIDCGSFSGSIASVLLFSDCTPKHLFVDPAPAAEESPDLFGRHVTIRFATALRARLVPIKPTSWLAGAQATIHCPSRTEPNPQESLLMAATNTIVLSPFA